MYTTSNGFQMKMLTVIPFGNKRLVHFLIIARWRCLQYSTFGNKRPGPLWEFIMRTSTSFLVLSPEVSSLLALYLNGMHLQRK